MYSAKRLFLCTIFAIGFWSLLIQGKNAGFGSNVEAA
jgi:hypothetical protein